MDIVDLTYKNYSQNDINCIKRLLIDKQGFERVLDNLHDLRFEKHNNAYFVVTYNKKGFIDIVCVIKTAEIKSTTFGEFISRNFNGAGVEIGYEPKDQTLYKIKIRSNIQGKKALDIDYHTKLFIEILDILTNKKNKQNSTSTNTNAINIIKNRLQTYEHKMRTMGTINSQLTEYKVLRGKVEVLREVLKDLSK